MLKRLYTLILFLFLFVNTHHMFSQVTYDRYIQYENRSYFVNGMNIAWNHFGGDFGRHPVWGSMYDSTAFEDIFTKCEAYGVNIVRLWIHCDGRANPEFSKDGFCTGWDTDFYLDLDDCFRRAKHHNILIMPCMWSFDMCKDFRESAGPNAGGHDDLLTNEAKMDSYIDNAFLPLVKRYKNQCNLFAWEVCNEPEWALDREAYGFINYETDTAWTYRTQTLVPVESMQMLTAKMAVVVHKNSNKMITIGSSAIRWNSDVAPSVKNIWSDKSLQKVYPNQLAYLDFYQVHFYDYMNPFYSDPFDSTKTAKYWKFDKPVIIGECPASKEKSLLYTPEEMIKRCQNNGYAGIMFWSHDGHDGFGNWSDFKDELLANYKKDPTHMHIDDCPCKDLDLSSLSITSHTKGKKTIFNWKDQDPVYSNQYRFEFSTDSSSIQKVKKSKLVKEHNHLKVKTGASFVRVIHRDIYGYERVSPWKKVTNIDKER